jgi:hypothetical protein
VKRCGSADPEPLGVIGSHPLQLFEGGLILDSFGDGLDLVLLGDTDDRLDDLAIAFVFEQVANELAVDLEVGEGSMTDPKVIQRERAAERP